VTAEGTQQPPAGPQIVVVMGVSGVGKSTVAAGIADALHWTMAEGDDFHSEANRQKMHAGTPLTDEDRWPWLRAIAAEIERCRQAGEHIIIACSALKKAYRDILVHGRDDIRMVYLSGSRDLVADRLGHRKGHFMPPGLLDSQFATLEPPSADERPITVSIDAPVEVIVDRVLEQLPLAQADRSVFARKHS
jgi:carbohydrate kinase (thermoresistant glucokinase family)